MKKIIIVSLLCYSVVAFAQTKENNIVTKGYHGTASVGGGYCFTEYSGFVSLQTVHGYQFNPYIFVGGGAGLELSDIGRRGTQPVYMPVFADGRFNAVVNKCAPFIELKLGYSIPLYSPTKPSVYGGLYFSPSIGVLFEITEKYSAGIAVEYSLINGHSNLFSWSGEFSPQVHHLVGGRLFFGF